MMWILSLVLVFDAANEIRTTFNLMSCVCSSPDKWSQPVTIFPSNDTRKVNISSFGSRRKEWGKDDGWSHNQTALHTEILEDLTCNVLDQECFAKGFSKVSKNTPQSMRCYQEHCRFAQVSRPVSRLWWTGDTPDARSSKCSICLRSQLAFYSAQRIFICMTGNGAGKRCGDISGVMLSKASNGR